jgi:hypothetical protein
LAFFSKANVMITFSAKLPCVWVENANFFGKFFCEFFFENHNICPWSPCHCSTCFARDNLARIVLRSKEPISIICLRKLKWFLLFWRRFGSAVARWLFFKPKIPIWVNFGVPYFEKC